MSRISLNWLDFLSGFVQNPGSMLRKDPCSIFSACWVGFARNLSWDLIAPNIRKQDWLGIPGLHAPELEWLKIWSRFRSASWIALAQKFNRFLRNNSHGLNWLRFLCKIYKDCLAEFAAENFEKQINFWSREPNWLKIWNRISFEDKV